MSSFSDFVSNPDVEKCLLVEVEAYDSVSSSIKKFYLSTMNFITKPTDTPANQIYMNLLDGSPFFSRDLGSELYGKVVSGYGDIMVDNSDGALDDWIYYGWDGRPITMRLGNSLWNYNDFVIILQGTVESITIETDNQIKLGIRDRTILLDTKIQKKLLTAPSPSEDKEVPLCYGLVYNISPVLIDPPNLIYQVHDGAIEQIVNVYDDGAG